MTPHELADRKAQLVAQADLDRMRLAHALLGTRQAFSPFAGWGGASATSLAGRALGMVLPLFAAARQHGMLRYLSIALTVARAARSLFGARRHAR